ncbi:MAG TPA: DUF2341 domain-containing protein [Baekduia sp.]
MSKNAPTAKHGRSVAAVVLTLAVVVAAAAALTGVSVRSAKADAGSGWQVAGAPFRMGLAVKDTNLSSVLADFPVKVVLTPQNFDYGRDAADGTAAHAAASDLAFVLAGDAADTQLPYQVETWNPGGTSVLWVQVPSVSSSKAQVELYYGHGGTYGGPAAAAASVWSSHYTSVNEFVPDFTGLTAPTLPSPLRSAPVAASAVGAGLAGLPLQTKFPDLVGGTATQATVDTNGATSGAAFSNEVLGNAGSVEAGQAVELSGNTSGKKGGYLTLPAPVGINNGTQTLSTTLYIPQSALTTTAAGGAAAGILGQHFTAATVTPPGTAPGSGGTGAIFMALDNACIYAPIYYGPGTTYSTISDCGPSGNATGGAPEPGTPPVTAGWHTVDLVLDGTSAALYIDGLQLSTKTLPQAVNANPTSPFIMGQYSSGSSGQGATAYAFDQMTFSDVARSSDWIQAEYASQTDGLITYGPRQDITTPASINVSGTGSTATLAWTPVDGATEYDVYQGTSPAGEDATPVATVTDPTTEISGLDSTTKYYFTVAAVTAGGTSAPSDEVEYAWNKPPADISATAFHDASTVQLRWTAPDDATSATHYTVHLGTSSGAETSDAVDCVALSATSCLVAGLNSDTTYYFTITADLDGTTSAPSSETSAATPASDTDGQDWQLSGSEYRLPLEVGDATLVDTLDNFPVKVVLTPKNFHYAGAASSDDLAFVLAADSNSAPVQLPYQVDTWNPGGTSVVWVDLPVFTGNVPLNNLELYYGGSADYAGPNAAKTWNNGYSVVNEFHPSYDGLTAPTLDDPLPAPPLGPSAAGAGERGLPTGTVFTDVLGGTDTQAMLENNGATDGDVFSNAVLGDAGEAAAGQGVQLSGSTGGSVDGGKDGTGGTYVTLPSSVGTNSGTETLSTTVYIPQSAVDQTPAGGPAAAILGQHFQSTTVAPPGWQQGAGGTGAIFMALANKCIYAPVYHGDTSDYTAVGTCGNNSTGGAPGAGQAPVTAGWHTVDVVLDGTSEAIYIDGVLRSTNTMPAPVNPNPTSPFILGQYSDTAQGNSSAYGYDHLSVAKVARSSSWVQAEYASQQDQLIGYGSSASVSTPTGVKANGSGDSVTISWDAVDGATGYEVHEGTAAGDEAATPVTCASTTATSCTVDDLPNGVEYFTVSAVTGDGTSLASSEVSYTYLAAPATVTAEAISNTSLAVSWSAVDDATSYSVYEGTTAGGEESTPIDCEALTSTSCLVTGLTQGDTYHFTVSADRDAFVSAPSTAEGSATPGSQTAWTIPASQERVAITLDTASATSSVLRDFPVKVQLPASFHYNNATPDSLVFTRGPDPAPLPYEVERWNPDGVSTVWVQVPALAPADPPLFVYYDGTPARSSATTDVWDSDFLGVYHFGDPEDSTTVGDATTHASTGTITYGAGGTGAVAFDQQGQDGSPSMTEMSTNQADVSFGALGEGLTQFTYSMSVGIDSAESGLGELVLGGRNAPGGTQPGEQFSILTETNAWTPSIESGTDPTVASTATYQGDKPDPTQPTCTAPVSYPASGWSFYDLTMTYDGTDLRFYVNGAAACTVPFSGPLEPGDLPFTIGMATPGGSKPAGSQWGDWNWDEMRVSDTARSGDWVAAENLADTGKLATTGAPQADFKTTGAFIQGTPRIGHTLTADTSGFSPAATVYSYQWYDNAVPILGANTPTLHLTPELLASGAIAVGDPITVQITGTDDGTTLSPTSQPVALDRGQFSRGTPTISGPAQVGGTLHANPGDWTPAGTTAYQWLRNGDPIDGATTDTYMLTAADAGQAVSVAVMQSAAGYADDSATSAPVTVGDVAPPPHDGGDAPVTGTPTIAGTIRVGQTVTAAPGTWSPSATPSYQWLRDGRPIAGATGASYVVVAADAGRQLSVKVTEAPSGVGSESAVSAAYEVQSGTFTPGAPAIGGRGVIGATLSAAAGNWSPSPSAVGYQWLRDGQAIAGATFSTYVVAAADGGHQISVVVRATAPGIETASATAPAIGIAPASVAATSAPSVTGTSSVGSTVMASAGAWSATLSTVSYQWLLDGARIAGATGKSYKIPASAAGRKLSIEITVEAAGYAPTTVTSAAVKVADGKLSVVKKPLIHGAHRVGAKLTVRAATWRVKPKKLAYQWLRNGKAIHGATRASFKVVRADRGATISVRLTATAAGYAKATVTTAKVKVAR